jgi:multidrug transporter EmrE-like cation transporter
MTYLLHQVLSALFACITLGDAVSKEPNPNFNDVQWSNAILNAGSPGRVMSILIGGHLNGHADALVTTACSALPFGVAFPIYAGWGLAEGTILNYFILGMPGNAGFLFGGVFFALLAIAQLAYSDLYDREAIEIIPAAVESPIHNAANPTLNVWTDGYYEKSAVQQPNAEGTIAPDKILNQVNQQDMKKWICLCILAGVINGLWSPFSTLGTTGPGAVTNPYVSLFLFECGQLSCLPIFLNYYGGGKTFADTYLKQLLILPWVDIAWGMASGCIVGVGFFFYFSASSVCP